MRNYGTEAFNCICGNLFSLNCILLRPKTVKANPEAVFHGTVNIVLGNQDGVVALTDSKVSDENGKGLPEPGQKLFPIDASSVCLIAGFVSTVAPYDLGRIGVPSIFAAVIKPESFRGVSIANRALDLAKDVGFHLQLLLELGALQRPAISWQLYESAITVVGYDLDGKIRAAKVDLIPLGPNKIELVTDKVITFGPDFSYLSAGIDYQVVHFLTDHVHQGNPAIDQYLPLLEKNDLQTIGLTGLQNLASSLAKVEAKNYPEKVGGPDQVAILRSHTLTIEQPTFQKAVAKVVVSSNIGNIVSYEAGEKDVKPNCSHAITESEDAIVIHRDDTYTNCYFNLSYKFIIGRTYKDVIFIYSGGPAYIDTSTNISEATLFFAPTAPLETETALRLRQLKWKAIGQLNSMGTDRTWHLLPVK